jgi:hypothetical protein
MLAAVKRMIFEMLPVSLQRERIIRKTGRIDLPSAQFTPSLSRPMYIPPKEEIWKDRLGKPYGHEPEVVRWYEKNLKNSDVIYDIGTHLGYYAALTSGLRPGIEFHGFEGNWFMASYFMMNKQRLDIDGKWHMTQKLVGDQDDQTFISINHYIRSNPVPTIFQMDVDGEEITVMKGATTLLGNRRTTFIIETHTEDLAKRGKTVEEFLAFFSTDLYDLQFLPDLRANVTHWREELSPEQMKDEFYTLAIPR